jgi:fibronectin-binding autotransporter adhesin
VTVSGSNAGSINATGTFTGIEDIDAGGGTNELQGPNSDTNWSVTGPDSGTVLGIAFSNFENLTGGTADDSFSFGASGTLSGTLAGGGETIRDQIGLSSDADVVSLSAAGAGSVTDGTDNVINSFIQIESIDGGGGSNELQGPNSALAWTISGDDSGSVLTTAFSNMGSLTGGSANDTFNFNPSGTLSGTLLGGDATTEDRINLSTDPDVVTITGSGSVSDGSNNVINSFDEIELIDGGGVTGTNTLVNGTGAAAIFNVSSAGAGTLTDTAPTTLIEFSQFHNLTGGNSGDTFNFSTALGAITGNLVTGSGTNTINFTDNLFNLTLGDVVGGDVTGGGTDTINYTNQNEAISVNLQTGKATGIGGNFTSIESFNSGSGTNDTLTGPDANRSWTINALNSGTVGSVAFTGFENLTGGSMDDAFTFSTANGRITGNLVTGTGTNSINFTDNDFVLTGNLVGGNVTGGGTASLSYANQVETITVNLQTMKATGIGGTFTGLDSITAGSATDNQLIGSDTGSVYVINGTNAGTIGGTFSFAAFQNLTGGTLNDQYTGGGSLAGALIDTSGTSTLTAGTFTAGSISFAAVTLTGTVVLDTSAANGTIQTGAITGGGNRLTLNSGAGTKHVMGVVSGLDGGGSNAALTLLGTGAATFDSTVTSTMAGIQATAATPVTFKGNVVLGDDSIGSTFGGLVTLDNASFSGFDGLTFNGGIQVATADSTINSNNSALNVSGLNGGGQNVMLQSGTGDTTLSGTVTNMTTLNISGSDILQGSGTWVATNITLNALRGIGASAAPIDTNTTGLLDLTTQGANNTGDIYLDEAGALSTAASRLIVVTDAATGQLVCISSSTGDFLIPANFGTAGDDLKITVNDGSVLNSGTGGTLTANTLNIVAPQAGATAGTNASPLDLNVNSFTLNVDNAAFGSGSVGSLGTVTLAGDLGLKLSNSVTQTGALNVGGKFLLDVGANTITLTDAGNMFGSVGLTAQDATVVEADDTEFETTKVSGTLDFTSGGDVTQNGGITAGTFRVATNSGKVELNGSNGIGTLDDSMATAGFSLNTSGALNVIGDIDGGGVTQIVSAGDLTLAGGSSVTGTNIVVATTGGEFSNNAGAGVLNAGGIYLIYSGTEAGTTLGGLLVNFQEKSKTFPQSPSAAGNGLLLREAPASAGDDTIVVITPYVPPTDTVDVAVTDFGLRVIQINVDNLGALFEEREEEEGTKYGPFNVVQLGEGDLEFTQELIKALEKDLSTEVKGDLLDAIQALIDGVGDAREAELPPGMVFVEDNNGNAVVIPFELLFDALAEGLTEEEKQRLNGILNSN